MGVERPITHCAGVRDRDGVIHSAVAQSGVRAADSAFAERETCPGVREALNELRSRGYSLIVVINHFDWAHRALSRALAERRDATPAAAGCDFRAGSPRITTDIILAQAAAS